MAIVADLRPACRKALLPLLCLLVSGCAYRFTNNFRRPPPGVERVAIEAVHDTARAVVPHEILWHHLQRRFAVDGRITVSDVASADAYVRAHLRAFSSEQLDATTKADTADPSGITDGSGRPHPIRLFRDLRRANKFSKKESVGMVVDVEIWDLRRQVKLLQKSYRAGKTFRIYEAQVPEASRLLFAEEGREAAVDAMSRSIAHKVMKDFLSLGRREAPPQSVSKG